MKIKESTIRKLIVKLSDHFNCYCTIDVKFQISHTIIDLYIGDYDGKNNGKFFHSSDFIELEVIINSLLKEPIP